MSLACALLGAWLSAWCPPAPPPLVEHLSGAVRLRPQVEQSADTANRMLAAAGEPYRITPSWLLEGRGLRPSELVVYLMQSPASPSARAVQRESAAAIIDSIHSDEAGIDETFEGCADLDDCVEDLYPEETGTLAIHVLNQLNKSEVGLTHSECRCIVLIEHDLRMFELVFGADWDSYVLITRYAGDEDGLREAIDQDLIPNSLTDGKAVSLKAMIAIVFLHEIGHQSNHEIIPSVLAEEAGLSDFIAAQDGSRREEFRADAFVASVLKRACFGREVQTDEYAVCLAPVELGMLNFVIGVKGKSREARCLRYFDIVEGYPNWQARFLAMGVLYNGYSSVALFQDYLETRAALARAPWVDEVPACVSALPD